ncbi:MAG: M81 family metallopeptidase [Rhodovarius sp.]|nr:M81 family metallopeptidase [Rhodovarius sp.]
MPHIAVARLWFEANSFAPEPTPLSAFRGREWVAGEEARERYRGTATELGGLDAFLAERPHWQASILRCAAAQPGGPMTDEAFATWWGEVAEGLAALPYDGVYLSLHGACLTESDPEADLTIIRRVRALVGPAVPVVASFDFHANLSPQCAALLDGASGYRTYPHTDMADCAWRALRLLEARLSGRRLHAGIAKLPRVLHSFHMRHEAGPMAEVWEVARAMEGPGLPDASIFGGFAWGDTPSAGPTALVWAEDPAAARRTARALIAEIAARQERFTVHLPPPEEALRQALAAPPGLVALLDPADNPLSGGACDTPGLLRALIEAGPPVETVFAFLHDPEAVAAARAAGLGGEVARDLCARTTRAFGPPVPFRGVVERLTEGRFRNQGPMETGSPVDLGPTAVLRAGRLRVILTSRKEAAVDPGFFALHGIDLSSVRLLANKAKNHFRAAFAGRCAAIVECDAPGPAALDLSRLPFRHVPLSWRTASR